MGRAVTRHERGMTTTRAGVSALLAALVALGASRGHVARAEAGASFVPARDPAATLSIGFEDLDELAPLRPRVFTFAEAAWGGSGKPTDEPLDAAWLGAEGEGLEGARALLAPAGRALVLEGDALAALANQRFEVRLWGRALGAAPELRVLYGAVGDDALEPFATVASVPAVETGRATADGWVEYATGTLDGRALGYAVSALALVPRDGGGEATGARFAVDLLEVLPRGPLPAAAACTQDDVDATCGDAGACVFGTCVSAAAVWGPLPAPAQRLELVDRWRTLFATLHEDREGAARARTRFADPARALAETARGPRAFFGGLERLLADVRAAHGSMGFFDGSSVPFALQGTSMGACFGEVERDLVGGGRGYGVFRVQAGSALRVGDVVTRIDGRDPAAWIAAHAPPGTPDPRAEAADVALGLASTLERLASSFEVARCSSAGACTTVRIDAAAAAQDVLARTRPGFASMTCAPRFRDAVTVPAGRDPSAYDAAFEELGPDGLVSVQTNGMPGDDATWLATVSRGFDRAAGGGLLFDARLGMGGGGAALDLVAERVRVDARFGVFFVGRWGHDSADGPPGFFDLVAPCWDVTPATFGAGLPPLCAALGGTYRFAPSGKVTPRPSRIAWLDVFDASANDMAAAFAKGAAGVRVFAPHPTAAHFGGRVEVPAPWAHQAGTSIQGSDNRVGGSFAEARASAWRSSRGVEPDVVVVQRQSDLLAGRDTMLEAARAWLKER